MALNRGLLVGGAVGQGLIDAVKSFREARRDDRADDRSDRQEKAQSAASAVAAAKTGYDIDPLTGSIFENENGKQQRRADIGLKNAQADFYRAKGAKEEGLLGGGALTPGQKSADQAFGKEYQERVNQGGYSQTQKGLAQLDEAVKALKDTDTATGPIIGMLPKSFRNVLTPKGSAIQDSVEEVVQKNLKTILGSQFTAKEGEQILARAYNPALSEEENVKRIGRLKEQIQQGLNLQKGADDYFGEKGTLKGFAGPRQGLIDTAPKAPALTPEQRQNIMEGLRKKGVLK